MIHEHLQEQAALYAVGALPPEEARAFEEQLRRDPELQKFTREMQDATAALLVTVPAAAPSPQLKSKIMEAIATPEPRKIVTLPERTPFRPWLTWLPWGVAACLALAVGNLAMEKSELAQTLRQHQTQEAQANEKINLLQTALAELQARDRVSQVKIAMLGSLLENAPKAVAVSVWDAEKQDGVLVVQNLEPLPADKDYQLWVVDPQYKNPVDGGVFSVDEKGTVKFRFKPKANVGNATKFAVSLEKKGGVPVAEGKMVLLGDML